MMLSEALQRGTGAQSHKFGQIPELIECLVVLIQNEPPDSFSTTFRQQALLAIAGFSNFRPILAKERESNMLITCLHAVFTLPATEMLESQPPSSQTVQAPDQLLQSFIAENPSSGSLQFLIQHLETWLQSDRAHERQRAMRSSILLLKETVERLSLNPSLPVLRMGHLVGFLGLLLRDPVEDIQQNAQQGLALLHQLLLLQQKVSGKGSSARCQARCKNCQFPDFSDQIISNSQLIKAFGMYFSDSEFSDLISTVLEALRIPNLSRREVASEMLLVVLEMYGPRMQQVGTLVKNLYKEISSIGYVDVQRDIQLALSLLGKQHPRKVVQALLTFSLPFQSQAINMWKALGAEEKMAHRVITILSLELRDRPSCNDIEKAQQEKTQLGTLAALNTIYELLYIREFRSTICSAFPGLLLGLLTEFRYLFELGIVEGNTGSISEETLEVKFHSPWRTCLEALKGLIWTTDYWEVFSFVKLQQGWDLFGKVETYSQGVTVLARAMSHYDCEIKGILDQAAEGLRSSEERNHLVGILIFTEFLQNKTTVEKLSRRAILSFLNAAGHDADPLVRGVSLQGLSSLALQPEKGELLRAQLVPLLAHILEDSEQAVLGAMSVMAEILSRLELQGAGSIIIKVASQLQLFFEDERDQVRRAAILLFGDVIYNGGQRYRKTMKSQAFRSLIPLLFHLVDRNLEVVKITKSTFMRCAILLKWEFGKELFSQLAWGHGLSAQRAVFLYLMENNSGNHHLFLLQAMSYLKSSQKNMKNAAIKFIGVIIQEYFSELCFYLTKEDLTILKRCFEELKQDGDAHLRRFAFIYWECLQEIARLMP
ncbi:maestro heat-like repeat family member 5 isoform X2 [Tachyglossus aculeatus]|uniref:maestro heat-like repeat family member 5 isoform X2 n=1 Tax=Tachyglossus aculeatus TaxID=9261 RepID=UPI0018F3D93E|nr:maestro heat-like repeat family member 5 isoform X2 [Tachyglossus aculeatus]